MGLSTVIWDFNGTLLDDARAALGAVNDMLAARGAEPMDFDTYQSYVETPVLRFYQKVEALREVPPERIFSEFNAGYLRRSGEIKLAGGHQSRQVLEATGAAVIGGLDFLPEAIQKL